MTGHALSPRPLRWQAQPVLVARRIIGLAIALVGVLLALTPLLAAPPGGRADVERLVAEATAARSGGDIERALDLLRRAYAIDPLPELLNNIGRTLQDLGRYAEAAEAYRKVTADPKADAKLRSLDVERLATLAGKLERGWIRVTIRPPDAWVAIDGEDRPSEADDELGVSPGRHAVVLRAVRSPEVVVRLVDVPAGRRVTVAEDLAIIPAEDGRLGLDDEGAAAHLSIDGHGIAAGPAPIRGVRLKAGRYEIRFGGPDAATWAVDLHARTRVELSASGRMGAPVPDVAAVPRRTGAWIALGVGLGMAGAGAGLLAWGAADRARIDDAEKDGRGVVVGMTRAEAQDLDASAHDKTLAGAVLVGVGAAGVLAGVLWAVLAKPAVEGPPRVGLGVGPGTLLVLGTF